MKIDPAIWWGVGLGGAALVALAVAQGKINLGGTKTSSTGTGGTGTSETDNGKPDDIVYVVDPREWNCPPGAKCTAGTSVVSTLGAQIVADTAVAPTSSTSSSTAKPTERQTALLWRKRNAEAAAGHYYNAMKIWEVGTKRSLNQASRGLPATPNANTKFALGATLCALYRDGLDYAYPDVEQCKRTGGQLCDELNDAASAQVRAAIEAANQFREANNLNNDPDFLKGLQSCSSTNLCAPYVPSPVWQGIPADVEAARRAEHERLRAALGCPGAQSSVSQSRSQRSLLERGLTILNPVARVRM